MKENVEIPECLMCGEKENLHKSSYQGRVVYFCEKCNPIVAVKLLPKNDPRNPNIRLLDMYGILDNHFLNGNNNRNLPDFFSI